MEKHPDFDFFSELMTNANMGWWEADLENEIYICSQYISNLLNLGQDGIISFSDFNKRILKEEQRPTTVHSFNLQNTKEAVYLLDTLKGPIWVRSKICFQKIDNNGKTIVYGIAETQDGPDMASAYQALQKNERILYTIYKYLPVGLELYDINGVLIDLNDKELDIFHLKKKEDILGINIFENPIFPEDMKEKLRNNENADFTFRYDFSKLNGYYQTKKKKGTIDLMTKVTTLYDENQQPSNYLLINTDKTESTVVYNKILEFEKLFELVGNYSKVGYAYFNILSQKGHASKSWYKNVGERYGISLNKIVGIYSHVHPTDRKVLNNFITEAKNGTAQKLSHEIRVLRKNGKHTWTHVNLLVNNYDPQNNIIELIAINYDITEMKLTEEMLINAKNKAEESDRLKSAFLASMSHEIRTPLNAIIGFSNLLLYADDQTEKEQYNALINHNNELLLKLIDDILDLSKIESGSLELIPSWFNLSEFIEECIKEFSSQAPPQVKIIFHKADYDFWVELDIMRIKQILNNFISNALKNTTQGSIEISYQTQPNGIKISVSDTGPGIPPDKIDKIFERFEKLNSFTQGIGLGLPICKSIVEKMGGKIGVISEINRGSTFWFEIPCQILIADDTKNDQP
ncbi:sensor histidine kinase [Coprobacter tertius]|uniref:histidine kinase n=1 Tax=Coprobacter tertius TaxID=2944915 RepID=A0ABT1MHH0_9BACT|nr:PAS domain-containing hybrid sensor histidine kinase/response regulator [Coprobacter tertius]MCP9612065.1 ATP-binding protein [Coprobacter tertius]